MSTPIRIPLRSLREGQEEHFTFKVSDGEMTSYAELSGDYNPLHCDESLARSEGFDGRVVYGGLLVSKVSRMIGMHLPGFDSVWNELRIRFSNPLYVGQEAELRATVEHVSVAARAVKLRLEIRAGATEIARGTAGVTMRNSEAVDG